MRDIKEIQAEINKIFVSLWERGPDKNEVYILTWPEERKLADLIKEKHKVLKSMRNSENKPYTSKVGVESQ